MESEFRRRLVMLLPRLMRFALALTRSRPDAEDLTQATCERALARMEQWEVDTRFDSWMFRIMHTIWLNNLRSRKVRERHRATLTDAEAFPVTAPAAEGRLMLAKVAEKVLDLPAEQRLVLMLTTVEGFSYREAAEIADIPIGTVMSRLARARLGLMKAIGEAEDGAADNVIRMGSK